MYVDFVGALHYWIKILNAADALALVDHKDGLTPVLGEIPVLLDGELCGHLVCEFDSEWSYREVKS